MRIFVLTLLLPVGIGVAAAADTPLALPAGWSLATAEHPLVAGSKILETVWTTARPPAGAFDRIALHRYRTEGKPIATLLYLPGTNMNGVAALKDEAHNLWLFLAARGIEVYALDYRTHFIPVDAPAASLDALKTWDTAAFVGDISSAAALARQESGQAKLYVAGFSRGVFLAYAYASTEPAAVAGLVLLDGPFKSYAPKNSFDAAAALKALSDSGKWGDDVAGSMGFETRQRLMDAVAANPDAPPTDPKYKTLGDQLDYILQNAWGPGGLANPMGGVSKPKVLATLLGGYDRYYPAIQNVDGHSIADHGDDPATPLDDNWGKFSMPIILFASTGMGTDWLLNEIYSAGHSGSKDVSINVLEHYGHVDVLVAEAAEHDVFTPTFAWLKTHAQPPAAP